MIRYSSTGKAVAKAAPVSETELIDSIEAVSAAAVECVECGIAIESIVQCMDNVQLAMTAIKNGGLTKQTVATFNGSGELSAFLGQESLTVAGLEAYAADQVKALSGKYVEGLEGKMAEYWAKFVAFMKNLWSKVVNWFKGLFTNRAKFAKALKEGGDVTPEQFEKNKDKEVSCIKGLDSIKTMAAYGAIVAEITKCAAAVKAKSATNLAPEPEFDEKVITAFEEAYSGESENIKISVLASDAKKFNDLVAETVKKCGDQKLMVASKDINEAFKMIVQDAGNAANAADDKKAALKDAINARRDTLNKLLKACRVEARYFAKTSALVLSAKRALQK
jgi:predicted nucleic acid-binding protein